MPRFAGPLLRRTRVWGESSAGSTDVGGGATGAVLKAVKTIHDPEKRVYALRNGVFVKIWSGRARLRPEVWPKLPVDRKFQLGRNFWSHFRPNFRLFEVLQ